MRSAQCRHPLSYVVRPNKSRLLDDLSDEREDEQRENRAPDERVHHHDRPPEDSAAGCSERPGDRRPGLAEESAENHEQDEMNHAERDIREQERFHCASLLSIAVHCT